MLKVNYKIITMPEEDYRRLPAISNSDLTTAKYLLAGIPQPKPQVAFKFGRAVHMALLEPERWKIFSQDKEPELCAKVEELAAFAMHNFPLQKMLAKSYTRKEQVVLWQCPSTGIACKARLDLYRERQFIADLKTTSASSRNEFLNHAEQFDYDRQLAFYGMILQPERYTLAGISKKKLGTVYFIHYFHQDRFIMRGRQKAIHLLQNLQKRPDIIRLVLQARE
ncbi:PD-(D/E)XK nuclease-like domain-containing protein [Limibacter armeniacum]|uniref:PD-(D/E)XK nuclease-like domain-containing protein n=1 Tax=Limibacter armeniacum TaxID=466084 RepID=UPI002FE667AC